MSFIDKVPHTFATIIVGEGDNSISFINRMDEKISNNNNIHLTNLSVEQQNADLIKYSFSVQYHPSTFSQADVLKLERMITYIMSNEAVDKNTVIKIKFGYISGSPYPRNIRKESYFYTGIILELKTNVQQNYVEYSFTACGTHKVADNVCLDSKLKLTTKDPITKWIKEKLMTSITKRDSSQITSGSNSTSNSNLTYTQQLLQSTTKGSSTNISTSNAFMPLFDFKSDEDLPSIEDLTGMFPTFLKAGLSNEEAAQLMREIHFEDILDFSQYESGIESTADTKQGSLTFPADYNLMTILNALCDKVNMLCSMEGIKYTKWKHLYRSIFKIVYDSTTIGNGELMGTIYFTKISDFSNRDNFNYVFNYGFINVGDDFIDHCVISWECDYNATYVIHDTNKVTSNEFNVVQALSPVGIATAIAFAKTALNPGGALTGIETNIDKILAEQNRVDVLQSYVYPYEATLTVLGNPEPIQVCRKIIQVIPKLNNSIHHTAGKYLVTGVSHNIDSSMTFTTTYNLIRLDEEHAKSIEANGSSQEWVDTADTIKRNLRSQIKEMEYSYTGK